MYGDMYGSMGGGLGTAFWVAYFFIFLIIFAIMAAAFWKIFEKAGEKGWKALVPYYNNYVMVRMSGNPSLYFWLMILPIFVMPFYYSVMFSYMATGAGGTMMTVLVFILLITGVISIVYSVKVFISLCERFGVSKGWVFGFFLLPLIFFPVLGFGKYKYTPKL